MSEAFKPHHTVTALARGEAWRMLMAMVPMAEADRGQHVCDDFPGPWAVKGRLYEGAWLAWPVESGFEPATVLAACYGDRGPVTESNAAIQ